MARINPNDCPSGMDEFVRVNAYLGREKQSGGRVGDGEWNQFADQEISSRFPDGFTVSDAQGKWRGPGGRTYSEPSKVLDVMFPDEHGQVGTQSMREIGDAYKQRFDQEAVLITASPICAGVPSGQVSPTVREAVDEYKDAEEMEKSSMRESRAAAHGEPAASRPSMLRRIGRGARSLKVF